MEPPGAFRRRGHLPRVVPGKDMSGFIAPDDRATDLPSAATDALGAAARQAVVVVSIGINERDGGTVYNAQLLFDTDGTLIQRRRKISPTYHERLIWGQGDSSWPPWIPVTRDEAKP